MTKDFQIMTKIKICFSQNYDWRKLKCGVKISEDIVEHLFIELKNKIKL